MLVRARGSGSMVSGAKTHTSLCFPEPRYSELSVGLLRPQTLFNVAGCSATSLLQTIWEPEKGAASFPHLSAQAPSASEENPSPYQRQHQPHQLIQINRRRLVIPRAGRHTLDQWLTREQPMCRLFVFTSATPTSPDPAAPSVVNTSQTPSFLEPHHIELSCVGLLILDVRSGLWALPGTGHFMTFATCSRAQ